jgi:hypothetical protein
MVRDLLTMPDEKLEHLTFCLNNGRWDEIPVGLDFRNLSDEEADWYGNYLGSRLFKKMSEMNWM